MKILFPNGGASREEVEELLRFAIEGRKRVKDQLMRIDSTYSKVQFAYLDVTGKATQVRTLEEEYPHYYHKTIAEGKDGDILEAAQLGSPQDPTEPLAPVEPALKQKHLTFQENQKGISFDTLLGPYLKGSTAITVTDPYIRLFYQMRNFMEFLETVVKFKAPDEEVAVHLVTTEDEFKGEQQKENLEKMKESACAVGANFTWEFDGTGTIHARHIVTDHGWKISLDRGLDIFQHYEMNDAFAFSPIPMAEVERTKFKERSKPFSRISNRGRHPVISSLIGHSKLSRITKIETAQQDECRLLSLARQSMIHDVG